jgi:hypothetical protein
MLATQALLAQESKEMKLVLQMMTQMAEERKVNEERH